MVFLRTVRETPLSTIADELYFLYALRTSTEAEGGGCGWMASLHILSNTNVMLLCYYFLTVIRTYRIKYILRLDKLFKVSIVQTLSVLRSIY